MTAIIIFIICHWYISLFVQSFFHHRYAAHQMFKMSKFYEKVFFVLAFIALGSSYMSPRAYGIMHRMHHSYADTEKDPHSPKYESNIYTLMVKTINRFTDILHHKEDIDPKYEKNLPLWQSFDNFASSYYVKIAWGGLYTLFYVYFATAWWQFLFLPMHYLMGPIHGVIINWFAHKIGYVNFKTKDTSKNLMPFDIFMLGEGYHNNHHVHSSSPNFAKKWYEIDPIYPIIKLFYTLRIIR